MNEADASNAFTLTSQAFKNGGAIPSKYTADGDDISPPLAWSNAPANTKELALIVDDPDAPSAQPWVHWVIYGLSVHLHALPAHVPHGKQITTPPAMQGPNSFASDNIGYRGPAPPRGHGMHHYHFTLYALDKSLNLAPGRTKQQLLEAMKGHILSHAELIGTYQR